jgi:PAS domain S-box-containing protein
MPDQAGQHSHEKRDLTSAILSTIGALVTVLDPQGRIVCFNPACERATGYLFDDVKGWHFWDLLLILEEKEQVKAVFEDLRAGRFPNEYQNRWVAKDGSERLIAWSNTALLDAAGSVEYVIGTGIDVTERMRAEEALREALARFESAIENTPLVAMQGFDRDGVICHWNAASTHLYGFDARGAVGQRLQDILLSGEAVQHFERMLGEVWDTGQATPPREWLVRTRDGEERWVYSTMFPTFKHGSVVEVFCMDVDITDRKRAEEEVRWQAKTLAALHETALDLATQRTLPDLLRAVQARAVDLMGAQAGGVYIYRPVPDDLELVFQYHLGSGAIGTLLKRGEGLPGKVLESRRPMVVVDCSRCESRAEECQEAGFSACVATPIFWGDNLLGVLTLRYDRPRTWSGTDVALLERFTPLVAAAMENARLYQEAQRRADRLALVNHASRAVSATLRLDDLMDTVYRAVAPLFQADAFCIALYDEEADELELKLRVNEGVREPPERLPRLRAGLPGFVVAENKPLLIRDFERERDRLPQAHLWHTGEAPPSWLGVPMRIGERVIGIMCVGACCSHAFGEEEQLLLSTIADEVAVAAENARLFEAVEQQRRRLRALSARVAEAEDSERRRLARELHDQVGQNLTALGINLNIVRAQMPEGAADLARSRLDDSLALVEQTAERIRGVMADLRPPLLDDYGLIAALHWYGAQFATRTGIAVTVDGQEPTPRLATPVENALFRITQEALTNVAKHARAAQVTVAVETRNGIVRLVVADDGVGFNPGPQAKPGGRQGWGLLTMAERAEALGGFCRVESRAGHGTRVIAEVAR